MVKTWSADNPKAALMERKRALIVDAALKAFLDSGYAEASVNHIAAEAGVSIKTLYRHFDSKDDLFSAVMQAACDQPLGPHAPIQDGTPAWYDLPPDEALPIAGEEYLRHVLSRTQLALYRVVAREADRFPDLGRRYQEQTSGSIYAQFVRYLELWAEREDWRLVDKRRAAQTFAALLKAGIFDEALLGLGVASPQEIAERAQRASREILLLLKAR